jgi:hypothetical protein
MGRAPRVPPSPRTHAGEPAREPARGRFQDEDSAGCQERLTSRITVVGGQRLEREPVEAAGARRGEFDMQVRKLALAVLALGALLAIAGGALGLPMGGVAGVKDNGPLDPVVQALFDTYHQVMEAL